MSTKKDKFSSKDKKYMKLALNLASARKGLTGVNPSVGCLIVKNDKIISIGQTGFEGTPHAEYNAINNSLEKLKNSKVIIWGAGDTGRELVNKSSLLKYYNIKINFFVDKYKVKNSKLNNILIKHPRDIQDDNSNIIIASTQFNEEIYHELITMGINRNRIIDSLFL